MATPRKHSTREQEVLKDLIEKYKSMPYLWRRDNEDYTNKELRVEGYKQLLGIYQEWDADADIYMVKKKIDNLRTNYRKELKKVEASQEAGDDKVYVPTLWYFDSLSFLISGKDNNDQRPNDPSPSRDPLGNDVNMKSESEHSDADIVINSRIRKRKLNQTLPLAEKPSQPSNSVERIIQSFPKKDEPWETTYGKSIGHQMKDLKGQQLVICQKLISDAIFYAKLNMLNENSHIENPEAEPTYLDSALSDSD